MGKRIRPVPELPTGPNVLFHVLLVLVVLLILIVLLVLAVMAVFIILSCHVGSL
jgi:hypothetical protein